MGIQNIGSQCKHLKSSHITHHLCAETWLCYDFERETIRLFNDWTRANIPKTIGVLTACHINHRLFANT